VAALGAVGGVDPELVSSASDPVLGLVHASLEKRQGDKYTRHKRTDPHRGCRKVSHGVIFAAWWEEQCSQEVIELTNAGEFLNMAAASTCRSREAEKFSTVRVPAKYPLRRYVMRS
jgi:hypothetical protein